MKAYEIAGYIHDGETICADCYAPHYAVQYGRRHGTHRDGTTYTGETELGPHSTRAAAIAYARTVGIDLDDDGEIMETGSDWIRIAWITDENDDGDPIYASTETDTPQHCAECGCLIETAWTRDCRRYVAEKIAEYVTDGAGDPDTMQTWADYASMSADVADARRIYAEIGGTWTHGTLRAVDLLDAAARCAESLADHCPDDADDLRRLAAEGRDAVQHMQEEDEEEDDLWLLEEITDAINAALPAPLYYGCTEGDGSDIGVWCSAEMD